MIIVKSSFLKSSVFKMFSVHTKTQSPRFQIFPGLKSLFETLCFCYGLVWAVDLTVETKSCGFKFLWRSVDGLLGNTLRTNWKSQKFPLILCFVPLILKLNQSNATIGKNILFTELFRRKFLSASETDR